MLDDDMDYDDVSTHSRPKAAGVPLPNAPFILMFQHTAARRRLVNYRDGYYSQKRVSTHSRPKAAGGCQITNRVNHDVSTHSRPKAAGCR